MGIAPGTKIHIKQAPLRPGIDFSERMYGAATFKGTGMSVLPGNAGHAEHEKLEAERFFTWTPEIQESPLDKAHVARSVVVDWNTEEYGATIKGEIDPGFRYMHNPGAPPRAPPPDLWTALHEPGNRAPVCSAKRDAHGHVVDSDVPLIHSKGFRSMISTSA